MRARKIYETLEFKQGGNPYKKLHIGSHRIFKEGDIIRFDTYVWGHYPDGNVCINCRKAQFQWTKEYNPSYKIIKIKYPYHLILSPEEYFNYEIVNGIGYWKSMFNRVPQNFDPTYGFPEWVQENPEAYTIIR